MEDKLIVEEGPQVLLPSHTAQADLPHAKIGSHMVNLILYQGVKHRICTSSDITMACRGKKRTRQPHIAGKLVIDLMVHLLLASFAPQVRLVHSQNHMGCLILC